MLFKGEQYELELLDEPTHAPGSADNARSYTCVYNFTDAAYRPSSRHGLVLRDGDFAGAVVPAPSRWRASGVHEHSLVIVGIISFVAVGDTLCALALPSFDLLWHRQVDDATCFGVHFSAKHDCLISHGELEIARVSLSGEVGWRSGGADIFTEGFRLYSDHVEVVDFYQSVYQMDIASGTTPVWFRP